MNFLDDVRFLAKRYIRKKVHGDSKRTETDEKSSGGDKFEESKKEFEKEFEKHQEEMKKRIASLTPEQSMYE